MSATSTSVTEKVATDTEMSERIADVEQFLAERGIRFDETQLPMVENHLRALKRRIASGEYTEGLEDAFGEVSKDSFDLARQAMEVAYGNDAKAISESEVFLLATHIEVAKGKAGM